ncbi:MAG TPA: excinuclease ABC subunit UvrA [Bdellovibrionota bacterium]|jgi:excinuclease ABC subunit A
MEKAQERPPIRLLGVRQNNLKNVHLDLPLGRMTVITGVSGSGKSSLAFDTLYAEGSRRYMESLSTYARQFLEKMPRPEVEAIHNVPPAIALEQRNSIVNNRTTVATMTEIYDYLRLLFAAAGHQTCKACGHDSVKTNDADSIADRLLALPEGTRLYLLAKFPDLDQTEEESPKAKKSKAKKKSAGTAFGGQELFKRGFQRLLVDGQVVDLSTAEGQIFIPDREESFVLVDRLAVTASLRDDRGRLMDSLEQALLIGEGKLEARSPDGSVKFKAAQGYACADCGEPHSPPNASLFSSNSPLGACESCSGFGEILELDEDLIVPDRSRSLRDGAVDPLSKPSYKDWEKELLKAMEKRGVPSYTRYKDLKAAQKTMLWEGDGDFPGIRGYFEQLKPWKYKLHVRVFIRRFQSLRTCPQCRGSRLSETPLRFRVGDKNVAEVLELTMREGLEWFRSVKLPAQEKKKAKEVLRQIEERLDFLCLVGVGYLKLNRKGNTLSGGEYQRISLASQLGSKLSNTLYVLDEPSIGLHPSDTDKLIQVIHALRDHGNTLVVVEHDASVMKSADYLVEVGPLAGSEGGEIVAAGNQKDFLKKRQSLTARYLSGELQLKKPKERRKGNGKEIVVKGCREHNLKSIDFHLPLGRLVAVTGVSGSGKSTIVHDTLYNSLARVILHEAIPSHEVGKSDGLEGWEKVGNLSLLDQKPIGRSSRSNTATYIKMYDDIRRMMASQASAARRHLTPTDFSFNVDGGRCATCKGEGFVEVDMHFMADVRLLCDDCEGKRFKKHVLEVQFRGKNIDEILHTTVKDAKELFAESSSIVEKCNLLDEVGLGYLQLGQSVSSLSGGECQRLKIAATLDEQRTAGKTMPTLYIFDEPTTGLHIHDVKKLVEVFHRLVDRGHTVLFIEHNMDLVAQADWVIDIGPGGGDAGGEIVAEGTPEKIAKAGKTSITANYLAASLDGK